MFWSKQTPIWGGWALGLLLCLGLYGHASAQRERPPRRGAPPPAAQGNPVAPPAQAPQGLSQNARIVLDQSGLSVDVEEQELAAIIERIAKLAQIELRHPEGMPNRRVSIRFASLPVVDALKRLFRVAEVPGYLLVTDKQGGSVQVQRIIFLSDEGASGVRVAQRSSGAGGQPPRPPAAPVAPPVPQPPPEPTQQEESKGEEGNSSGSVTDELKSNAAARRLLSQMMHPNVQVRERAFEGLVRLVREDSKQREMLEILEPIMEDLASEEQATQDAAREEIRKLLSQ